MCIRIPQLKKLMEKINIILLSSDTQCMFLHCLQPTMWEVSIMMALTSKFVDITLFFFFFFCWSQWPRGLRRRSAAALLLRLWVRIPQGAWMFVCCQCCVLLGRSFCDKLITRPEESYRLWCVVVCDLETSWMRRPWLTGGCRVKNKQTNCVFFWYMHAYWIHSQILLIQEYSEIFILKSVPFNLRLIIS